MVVNMAQKGQYIPEQLLHREKHAGHFCRCTVGCKCNKHIEHVRGRLDLLKLSRSSEQKS